VQERTRVAHRIDELAGQLSEGEQEARRASLVSHAASTELAVAEAARHAAGAELAATEDRAGRALAAAGFRDEREVRAAVLDPSRSDDIDRRGRRWREDHAVAVARVADLEHQVGADEVAPEQMTAAVAEAEAARDELRRLLSEHGSLERERLDVEQRIVRAAELRDQLAEHEATHATYDQLASDLRTDQLQAFLLEGTFREIVAGASVRLLELSSGRYALDYANDDFYVVDHDNARERRRADTLSGGETFLAALSLALQLSDQVQRVSGAARLDSLFIDEGFGTLDRETLATVGDAIQQLGRGHRLVGIITHVQELTAVLPSRIDVRPGPDGSKIEVVSEA
jgi:DNA repair protein SbcC/Rad50